MTSNPGAKNMMRTFRRQAGALAMGAVAVASAALGACSVDATPYLVIKAVRGIAIADGGCAASDINEPSSQYDAGTAHADEVKALGAGKYLIGFQLANALSPNGDEDTDGTTTGRLDSNRIQLTELKIKLDNREPWDFLPADNSATLTQLVGPNEELSFIATVFDETLATAMLLGAEGKQSPIDQTNESFPLNVSLQILGRTLDGTEVESNVIEMTITICNRCLDTRPGTTCIEPCGTDADCTGEGFISSAAGCSLAQADGFVCGGE